MTSSKSNFYTIHSRGAFIFSRFSQVKPSPKMLGRYGDFIRSYRHLNCVVTWPVHRLCENLNIFVLFLRLTLLLLMLINVENNSSLPYFDPWLWHSVHLVIGVRSFYWFVLFLCLVKLCRSCHVRHVINVVSVVYYKFASQIGRCCEERIKNRAPTPSSPRVSIRKSDHQTPRISPESLRLFRFPERQKGL